MGQKQDSGSLHLAIRFSVAPAQVGQLLHLLIIQFDGILLMRTGIAYIPFTLTCVWNIGLPGS